MTPIGYFAAAGLTFVGGIKLISAKIDQSSNNKLESAVNASFPEDEQVKNVAIRCLAHPLTSEFRLITNKPGYFWRISVEENKTSMDIGIGPLGAEKADSGIILTPKHHRHIEKKGYPSPLTPISSIGNVIVHDLDLAKWVDGVETKKHYFNPKEAAPLLRKWGIKPDFSASSYVILVDQFMEPEFTIFGNVSRGEDGYIVYPQLVTTLPAEEYLAQERLQEKDVLRKGKLYALGGCLMGSATWTLDAQLDYLAKYHRPLHGVKLTAGYAALTCSVLAFQRIFASKHHIVE